MQFVCVFFHICRKFEFLISRGRVATCLRRDGQCHLGFVANCMRFPAVQKCWKSVRIWQSYRQFKGENFFFWDTVYILLLSGKFIQHLITALFLSSFHLEFYYLYLFINISD